MVLAGMTACTNEDNIVQNQQPAAPQASVYQVSIPATIGDGAETRAVELGTGDKAGWLVSTFKTTDDIAVYNLTKEVFANNATEDLTLLHPDQDGATANLTGALKFYQGETDKGVSVGDQLLLLYGTPTGGFVWNSQIGDFSILSAFDHATATVEVTAIDGNATDGYTLTTTKANFKNAQSMFKFTFTGLPEEVGVKKVTIHSAQNKLVTSYLPLINHPYSYGDITLGLFNNTIRAANGPGVAYAALRFDALAEGKRDNIAFTVTGTDEKTYIATKDSPEGGFQNGKYYTSTIALAPTIGGSGQTLDLSTVSSNIIVLDGTTLTGTLGSKVKISIAPGATVTLNGVTIDNSENINYCFECMGDATIILAEGTTNTLKSSSFTPGLLAGPAGSTLTIQGEGTLIATGNGGCAGIGGKFSYPCGAIVIKGGTITATGHGCSAGIGSGGDDSGKMGQGDGLCGDITISSGNVTATAGTDNAAGIGSGSDGSCGNITISGGTVTATGKGSGAGIGSGVFGVCGNITIESTVTRITATRGANYVDHIGRGDCGNCGDITIDESLNYVTSDNTMTLTPNQ